MFNIPRYIPTENEAWEGSTELTNLYYEASNMHEENNLYVHSNALGRQQGTLTIINPLTHLLYAMLAYENVNRDAPKKTLKLEFSSLQLEENAAEHMPTGLIPLADSNGTVRNTFKIRIYKVTRGSTYMEKFDKEAELKTVSLALQRSSQHKIRVYKHNDYELSIYTNVWNWELYYQIAGLIPKLLPVLWPTMSPELEAFAVALVKLDRDALIKASAAWETKTNYAREKKLRGLKDWSRANRRKRMENMRSQHEQAQRNIRDYENSLKNYYDTRNKLNSELFAMEHNPEESDKTDELIEYMSLNKTIKDFQINGSKLTLYIYAPLKYVDTDMAEHNYIKRTSFNRENPEMAQLFKAAYIDESIELWTMTVITIDLNGTETLGGESSFTDRVKADYALHPHINRYSCFGNNKNQIIKGLKSNDYIQAIEQCIAAGMNLNFSDSAVIDRLKSDLTGRTKHISTFIKIVETGEFISYAEFCKAAPPTPVPTTGAFEEVIE